MKKEITLLDFLYDIREHKKFSDDAIVKMYEYMEENYDVQNYEPKTIAKKFAELTWEDLKLEAETDVERACIMDDVIYRKISKQDFIRYVEETKRWHYIGKTENDKMLFDLDYYNIYWENY